jgi:hypothetical protein
VIERVGTGQSQRLGDAPGGANPKRQEHREDWAISLVEVVDSRATGIVVRCAHASGVFRIQAGAKVNPSPGHGVGQRHLSPSTGNAGQWRWVPPHEQCEGGQRGGLAPLGRVNQNSPANNTMHTDLRGRASRAPSAGDG